MMSKGHKNLSEFAYEIGCLLTGNIQFSKPKSLFVANYFPVTYNADHVFQFFWLTFIGYCKIRSLIGFRNLFSKFSFSSVFYNHLCCKGDMAGNEL